MNKQYIILIVAVIVIIIVAIILVIVVVHHTPPSGNTVLTPVKPLDYPFKNGEKIRLGFVKYNNLPANYTYSFYNLIPATNGSGTCVTPRNTMNITDLFNDQTELTVTMENTTTTNVAQRFAMKTASNGYLFLGKMGPYNLITFGGKDSPDDSCWFTLAYLNFGGNNYVLVANDQTTMGIIGADPSCYSGPIVNTGGANVGYVVGSVVRTLSQQFFISNITTPIKPFIPIPTYGFATNDSVLVTFTDAKGNFFYLFNGCSVFDTTITFTQANIQDARLKWIVTLSSDQRAFALSQNGAYLQTIVDFSTTTYKVSVVGLSMGTTTLSNYDQGDYTNWFQLSNSVLISLLTNMAFDVNVNDSVPCSVGDGSHPIHGVDLMSSKSPITITRS